MGPSKGFGRQATRSKIVAKDHFQSADKRQKLLGKSRQLATATNCMQHNQTNIQFQRAASDTGYPLGGPRYWALIFRAVASVRQGGQMPPPPV